VPAKRLIAAAALFVAVVAWAPVANAAGGDTIVVTPAAAGETLYMGIEQAARGKSGPGTGPKDCTWTLLSLPGQSGAFDSYRDSGGILWQAWLRSCPSVGNTTYWVPLLPPSLVVPAWRDDLVKKIPKTEPVWSPLMPTQYVSYPTYVWLDKAKTADVFLEVSIPSARATMTAKASKVVFNPGIAADAVTCERIPLKREDCSYTYRRTSKDEDKMRYAASVSVTWDISWTATTGESGTLPSYTATFALPIAVAKIQIVGA
jgi:hypothetical protein